MIGERLKKLRQQRKISQEELGAILGVQGSAVSRYEKDKDSPNDGIKVEIAKYFNTSLDYLLGVIAKPVPYYDEEIFLRLPDNMTKEEKIMVQEFFGYLEYRKGNRSDA